MKLRAKSQGHSHFLVQEQNIKMKKIVFTILLFGAALSTTLAQELNVTQTDDVTTLLGFNPDVILNDWKAWDKQENEQNKFIGEFMRANNVPADAQWHLTKYDTWMWWIQTNPEKSKQYLELRKKSGLK